MQPNQNPATNQPNQVQLSTTNHHGQQSLPGNLLISASSFSPLNRQAASSPLSALNSSSILHPPIATIHPNSHLVHPNQLISPSQINAHNLPLPQSVLQSAQLLRNNYDSLFYVNGMNGQLPAGNKLEFNGLPNPINFNAISQLNQLSHQLNQIPIAAASMCAAAASLHSLQQQQQNHNSNNDNTSDNLSVCSNLSGSMKSEENTLNSSICGGFNAAFKLSNSLKQSTDGGGLLGATTNGQLSSTAGQLRANASTPNAVNELKFSVNSILNASNYGGTQLRNDGKSHSLN